MFVLFYTARCKSGKLRHQTAVAEEVRMRRSFCDGSWFAALAIFAIEKRPRQPQQLAAPAADGPQFTADGKLVRPTNYRKWVFLSSGYGMSYSQKASDDPDHLMFTNVFRPTRRLRLFPAARHRGPKKPCSSWKFMARNPKVPSTSTVIFKRSSWGWMSR